MKNLTNATIQLQKKYHNRLTGFDIQGSKPHKSSRDPNDPAKVITVGFYADAVRYLSIHLHEDGTFNQWESRGGKGKGKGKEKQGGGSSSQHGSGASSSSTQANRSHVGSAQNIEYNNGYPVYRHSDNMYYPVYEDREKGAYYYIDSQNYRHDLK
ncbi:hypothetical protein F5X98DRAFT_375058 [Xylaria grammica]|nr:hypothetical protein F5X98DRAFT_375058 [Xylaria grammica]